MAKPSFKSPSPGFCETAQAQPSLTRNWSATQLGISPVHISEVHYTQPNPSEKPSWQPKQVSQNLLSTCSASFVSLNELERVPTAEANANVPCSYSRSLGSLITFLQRRLSSVNRVLVAKALASIQPLSVRCMGFLDYNGLVTAKQCFQNLLRKRKEYIKSCGGPTVLCR
jgi:hypothetical protein